MSNRGGEIKLSLKERIAALGLEGHGAASSSSASTGANSNALSTTYSTGSSPTPVAGVRDKAARFESIGGVPVPRGSFGLGAPPAFSNLRKTGELYGNRIPSGNGRSPGSSPGRSPADDTPEFTRIRLRSVGSAGSLGDAGAEIDTSTWIQVIPPTPAFPPPEFSPRKLAVEVQEALSSSPEPVTVQASQSDEAKASSPLTPTDTAQEVEVPAAVSRVQELDSIPESPVADQTASSSVPPPRKASAASTASKRHSLVLKNSTASTSTDPSPSPRSAATEPTDQSTPRRSSSLAPSITGSPRKARSQAPSRASSVSSTSSVFTSPPSDEGEISGGGNIGSPTLETLDADVWEEENVAKALPSDSPLPETGSTQDDEVALEIPDQPPSPHISPFSICNPTPDMAMDGRSDASSPPRSSPLAEDENAVPHFDPVNEEMLTVGDPREMSFDDEPARPLDPHMEMSPARSIHTKLKKDAVSPANDATDDSPVGGDKLPGPLAEEPSLSEVVLPPMVTAVPEKEAEVSESVASLGAPTNRRDLLAETASPARVLRELRQLGMEKQSSIVIVSPRKASILSMMITPTVTDLDPADDDSREETPISRDAGVVPTQSLGVARSPTNSRPTTQAADTVGHLMMDPPPIPKKEYAADMKHASQDVSPTAASDMSIPQSFSGTSDASYARLSFASSLREMVTPPSNFADLEPARPSSDYAPSFLAPPSPNSNIAFVSETQDTTRNMTPSPPPSFRSLYASGRLPPSSRGPGPHLPSGKVPLLQRAVTLMSRSLPPIPRDELPPRRSLSAFQAIRSRTTSKAKREQAKAAAQASERASISSDMTITEDLPPRLELVQPRARTSSSPLLISVSHSGPPPVPPLPPIVTLNDAHPITPPIARLFMEQRANSQRNDSPPNQPPTAFRSASPTPSTSSAQASMSSCAGNPSHLFSSSFDEGIFDAFPEVPGHFPSSSIVARHSRLTATGAAGRGHLGILPNRSFSRLEDHLTGGYSGRIEASKSQDGHVGMQSRRGGPSFTAAIKSVHAPDVNDPTSPEISPVRRKTPSRKLIPGWYDDDDDEGDGDNETGWASVQVIRSRLM